MMETALLAAVWPAEPLTGGALDLAARCWWGWVLPAALQATPVLLLAALLDLAMPRLSAPHWRAGLWVAGAAKLLFLHEVFSPWGLIPPLDITAAAPPQSLPAWAWVVPSAWAAGCAILLSGSALFVRRRLREWDHSTVPADCALRASLEEAARELGTAPPRLVCSRALQGPLLFGIWKPTLYWPSGMAATLSDAELHQVLRHEVLHAKRRDGVREALWSLLLIVFWFHPLLWWAVRRVRAIREQCCDWQAAKSPGHSAGSYLSALLRVATQVAESPASPGVPLVDPRAALSHRIALLSETRPPRRARWERRLYAALCMALLLATWPAASWADKRSATVAEWIIRPPGSMQLRFLVLERLAQEEDKNK